jgi:hypothetical protein
MATSNDKQVSEAAFLKALASKKQQLVKSAKKARPSGLLNDLEILEKLGIGPNESKTFNGNVQAIKFYFAKQDAARPAYRFAYVLVSSDKSVNGTIVSKNIILEETDYRTLEQHIDDLMYELQGLGEETDAYKDPLKEVQSAVARHTKEKTALRISIKHWVSGTKAGMNIRVNPVDDSDLATEDEEAPEDEEVEDVEAEDEEFEEVDPPETEESGDDEEFDPDAWIDGWIDYKFEGDDAVDAGTYTLKVVKYHKKSNTFDCVDEDGAEWNTSEGYGIPCAETESYEWSDKNDE